MKLINLIPIIYLLFLYYYSAENKNFLLKNSLIKSRPIRKEISSNPVTISADKLDNEVEKVLYEVEELIDLSELSEDEEDEEDQIITIDDLERSNLDVSSSVDEDMCTGKKVEEVEEDNQNSPQNEDELVIDKESEKLGFNPKIYFNSHKCFLMLGFEIEFLENPVLNNSGVVKYIKEVEINSQAETKEKDIDTESDKYQLIELETRNNKLDEIISLMKQIRESCWNINSEETLQEFKNEILNITEVIESKISQINDKLENYIKITDKKNSSFDSKNYEKNSQKKSKLFGRKSSYELALSSFKRIEEYWTHIENLPCNI